MVRCLDPTLHKHVAKIHKNKQNLQGEQPTVFPVFKKSCPGYSVIIMHPSVCVNDRLGPFTTPVKEERDRKHERIQYNNRGALGFCAAYLIR